ncbi:hypothetical protein FAZ69_15930 [Trinickia terrae]|uniref:DUF2917 domain-containing protein n=1 Tax=Trinickia terrae TaxID=2571161 RepID=A0A4U1I3F3_9BURK|nr:hypothetical protein [Trinickia terrae]TKC87771.1 hypothetical protein FAZ69_15930 [Trinickia terrae]
MDTRDSAAQRGSTSSTIRLHSHQTLTISLPRNTRLVATDGAVQLSFVDPALDWLGEAAPINRLRLNEGDSYVVEQSCYATVSGASTGVAAIHIEQIAVPSVLKRVRAWITHRAMPDRTSATPQKAR